MKLNGFNRIAPYYDRLATFVFGESIKVAQTYYLKTIPKNARVLVIGGGTGWWLKELYAKNPQCEVWFIEASSEMLKMAADNSKGKFVAIHGTEEDIPDIQFDVIVTYFFLDLFSESEMKKVINRIGSSLKAEGIWLISDFVNNKWWHRVLLQCMYKFFMLIDAVRTGRLAGWERNLQDCDLQCSCQKYFFGQFIKSSVYRNSIKIQPVQAFHNSPF